MTLCLIILSYLQQPAVSQLQQLLVQQQQQQQQQQQPSQAALIQRLQQIQQQQQQQQQQPAVRFPIISYANCSFSVHFFKIIFFNIFNIFCNGWVFCNWLVIWSPVTRSHDAI